MNRFTNRSSKEFAFIKYILRLLPLIIGLIMIAIFLFGVNYVSSSSLDKQQESLENAIMRDVAQCYAVEGSYPPSLDYLKDHYGLTYNEELFFVDYHAIGDNLMPDVTIIRMEDEG